MSAPAAPEAPAETLASMYAIGEPDPVHDTPAEPPVESDATTKPATPTHATPAKPAAAAAAAAAAAPAKPAAPTHPAWLTAQVETLGLPENVLKMSTDDLGSLVAHTNRQVRQEHEQLRRAATVTAGGDPKPPPAAVQPQEPAIDWGEMEDEDNEGRAVKRKITDADIHPALAKVLKQQAKQIADLTAVIQQGQQTAAQAQERTLEQRLDAAFSANPALFGQGSASDVKDTPAMRRRRAVYAEMRAMPPEARQGLTIEQAVAQVAADLFGEVAPAKPVARNGKSKAVEDWNAGAVAKPTQRVTPEKSAGREKAVAGVREWQQEHVTDPAASESDATLDEFLP